MKRLFALTLIVLLIFLGAACSKNSDTNEVETTGIIIRKEVLENNRCWLYVEYEIEGMEGTFEASIMLPANETCDNYEIGDTYIFMRPVH